jgi:molybdopterin molybdotransferase
MAHDCGDVAHGGKAPLLPLADALAEYARRIQPLAPQPRPLLQSLGQVLAAEAHSQTDLPLFTQSAVDGYALRFADGSGPLQLVGEVAAGATLQREIASGEAVRIFTGGALPPGTDSVARQEIVQRDGALIRLQKPVAKGSDTRFRGEEIRQGEVLAAPGQRLHSGLLAALAMAGVADVHVQPRPRVAVLVTGNEVAQPGETLDEGRIFDANGPLISAWLAERGYPLSALRYVADTLPAVIEALEEVSQSADLVISTGGVSVGDHDHLPAAAQAAGYQRVFWKVAQKPGKPIWFGMRGNLPLLALPGNPAAVLIGLHVHVIRALELLEGRPDPAPRWRSGLLADEFRCDAQRDSLLRVRVEQGADGCLRLARLPRQDSHMLSNLARADALAWLPTRAEPLAAGTPVRWIPLD